MSTWASRKLARVVDLGRRVLGMEFLAAAQALEFHRPLTTSAALENVVRRLRDRVPRLEGDRFLADDMDAAAELVFELGESVEV
jgi:histidine ammonia-lyase